MFGNNYGNGAMYSPYGIPPTQSPQPYGYQPYGNPVPKTNMLIVTSLEEALLRPAEPNSNMFYIDQDKPLGYKVMTDMQGKKTYKTFDLVEHAENPKTGDSEHLTRADVEEIVKKQIELYVSKEVSSHE